MRVLVLGASGMLGHKLLQVLDSGFDVWGTVYDEASAWKNHPLLGSYALAGGVRAQDMETVSRAVSRIEPDVVINCIGVVKQLPGASDPFPCLEVNSIFPNRLSGLCAKKGCRLIHFSTDCVFSGQKGNYSLEDTCDAQDLYGRSKYLGELYQPGCLTLRSSFIGRQLRSSHGLLEWFIGNQGGKVPGFTHAIYSGLTSLAMARLVAWMLREHEGFSGVWQVASPPISKYELLRMINHALGLGIEIEKHNGFQCDRSLEGSAFNLATGFRPPPWKKMVAEIAADQTPYELIRSHETPPGSGSAQWD